MLWLQILLTLFSTSVHDFHVSRIEVVYRTESKSFEITQHMFADDVELALREIHDGPVHLSTEIEIEGAEALFRDYLTKHLEIEVDGKAIPLTYLGREPGEDNMAMWAYVEATDIVDLGQVRVFSDFLCEIFNDQKNILSFQVDNGSKQMFLLDRGAPDATIDVNE